MISSSLYLGYFLPRVAYKLMKKIYYLAINIWSNNVNQNNGRSCLTELYRKPRGPLGLTFNAYLTLVQYLMTVPKGN